MRRVVVFVGLALFAPLAFAQVVPDVPEEEGADAGASASVVPSTPPVPQRKRPPQKDGMLLLPGGHFIMGSKDPSAPGNERPTHDETLAAFWIDKTEVTVSAYRACVDQHKCGALRRTSTLCTYDLGEGELPVNCIHWSEADTYCRAMNKRLPRETEFEFAARGTSAARYPWGGGASSCGFAATLLNDQTGRRCTGSQPAKVGSFPNGASVFGVLDLSGNVEEWTSDWYADRILSGATPRSGSSHVLRGGGWLTGPSAARTTSRNWGSSMESGPNVGFRCAKNG